MRITQGTFSFLPELTDEEISLQIDYALRQGWACSVEFTDDPHPRNTYWEMWGLPMFDLRDAAGVLQEVKACRAARPQHYIKVNAFDSERTFETMRLSFIVNRPDHEPGFRLERQEVHGRMQRYGMSSYAADRPAGERYEPPR
ncbi:Ribulose bisphosphate carboxylase small chain, chromosomal [Paraburkholderia ribeironis]|uniref:Ribulose bisphosphate carboxylase small subunit n=1 Tax=Paraburkholderia ribeironis TaxID=1247936 RepID=A0A1N7RTU0_9BURK|nr:ribulose bisphosphate carboxylase small subunit [Paraburkholderia ribeironis]SIT38512.1 Ribulose bisphosphate carboxylase small chain, chromosomal [Paraburkholderia ribeironis]